jgi:hypothetical protein
MGFMRVKCLQKNGLPLIVLKLNTECMKLNCKYDFHQCLSLKINTADES